MGQKLWVIKFLAKKKWGKFMGRKNGQNLWYSEYYYLVGLKWVKKNMKGIVKKYGINEWLNMVGIVEIEKKRYGRKCGKNCRIFCGEIGKNHRNYGGER